jgi:MFS family permease
VNLLGDIREEMACDANIRKLYVYRFLHNFMLWWPIWVLYLQKERGLSLTQITLMDTPFFLITVLSEVPTGAVADRFGRKTSLMIGTVLVSTAVGIFGIASNYPLLLASYCAWGLGISFQSGSDIALLFDNLKAAGREHEFQKLNSRIWAVSTGASLVAMLIGAPIAAGTSYSFVIVTSAVICLAAAPVAMSMHEPRLADAPEHAEAYFSTVFNGIRDAWRQPALRYMILLSGLVGAAAFTPIVFIQPFLDGHGIGTADLGLWQAPPRAIAMVGALATVQIVSRLGQRGSFVMMPGTLIVCMLMLAGVDSLWAYVAFIGMGSVVGVMNPIFQTYINHRIPSERRATMLSVQNVVMSIMLAFAEPMGGALADIFGLRGMYLVYGLMTLAVAVPLLIAWQRADAAMADEVDDEGRPVRETPSELTEIVAVH